MHLIKKVIDVSPYSLVLLFNNGEKIKVDLEQRLRDWSSAPKSKFKELLEPSVFNQVELNDEMMTVCWSNGLDLCPDFLYSLGEKLK